MRLRFFEPELARSVRSFIRRIDKRLSDLFDVKVDEVNSLIVLGDGYEDARVVSLLCHHLDGEKVVGVIKPEYKRYDAIRALKEGNYISGLRDIVFIMDQEDDSLEDLYGEFERALNYAGVAFRGAEEPSAHRVRSYRCSLGGHEFGLVVVVNGLDDVGGPVHKIEDHLARLAGVGVRGDSKDAWAGLDEEKRREVFRRIYANREEAESVFAQHFSGLGLLDC